MIKKIVLGLLVLLGNAYALGGYGALTKDGQGIVDEIQNELKISQDDAVMLYEKSMQDNITKSSTWYYYTYDNDSVTGSKSKDNKSRVLCYNMVEEDRHFNLEFTKLHESNQVLVYLMETLPRSKETVLEKYRELKKHKDYTLQGEEEQYAVFTHNTTTTQVYIMIHGDSGTIQYAKFRTYTLTAK